ncbi:MAG: pilus assembly protein CpaB [Solirubrobacteraceae bacterium]|jgi:pilus assembly protein CpaB|nr:pilus assembly protein CpaB [Solirubrobacteraceae bacterium]
MSRRRRAAALLGLSLLLGVLAASDVAGREAALRDRLGRAVPVVVVRLPLAAGERITRRALAVRLVPARYAPGGALRDPGDAIGRRVAVPVAPGADLDPALLAVPGEQAARAGPALARDERALDLVALAAPEAVVPGARVDVLVTYDGERADAPGATRVALADAEVLAARPAGSAGGADADAGLPRVQATLRVGAGQAVALTAALSTAREVRLLARPRR